MHPTTFAIAAATFFAGALLWPSATQQRARLSKACLEQGEAGRCQELGERLESGKLGVRYPEEPGLYFAVACEGGAKSACARADVWAKRYDDYEMFETDVGCMLRNNAFACE